MVGLLGGALGWGDNPWYQGFDQRRMAIGQFGAGLASGKDWQEGLAKGTQGALQGYAWDLDEQQRQQELQQAQDEKNHTLAYMQQSHPDLYQAIQGGMSPGDAWNTALQRDQQAKAQSMDLERARANAAFLTDPQLKAMVEGGAMSFEDAYKYQMGGDMPAAPSGYQWTANPETGQTELAFIPGGPHDPAAQAANRGDTEQTRRAKQLATVVNPELQTVMTNWDSLSNGGNQFGNAINFGTGMFTGGDYQSARNALNTIAQSYLYSVSGAAAPAEEVKKLVDSVTPIPFENPQSVELKKQRVQQMVEAINLMAQGGTVQQPGGPGVDDPLGIR